MTKLEQIKSEIKAKEPFLMENFRVKKIGVFGSYSRQEQKKTSDIDILVEFYEDPSLFKFLDLENYLSEILKIKVDLVMKNCLKPNIGKQIINEVVYL